MRWFSPGVLAGSALRVLLSKMFGAWLDKRELQEPLRTSVYRDHAGDGDLWLDYIADTGDGFGATYTVAWTAAQAELQVDGLERRLPRGQLLVLGGDQVYPVARASEYECRLKEPFRASLPWTADTHPELWAIPGNHDWYDGLTSFLRVFAQGEWIGGRRTVQSRSYFALELPHRWWLWGIDTQFDAYVDAPQVRYFEAAAAELRKGDRIILCVATPSWIDLPVDPAAYRNIAYIERRCITPKEATVALTLSGDSHHYARYTGDDGGHRITAGGGGAFLHPTHNLPRKIDISSDPDDPDVPAVAHRLETCFPGRSRSRRLLVGALALPFRNPSFAAVLGGVHVVMLRANQFGLPALERPDGAGDDPLPAWGFVDLLEGLIRYPFSLFLVIALAAALMGFAKPPPFISDGRVRLAVRLLMGVAHTAAHLVAVALVSLATLELIDRTTDDGAMNIFAAAVAFVAGGIASGVVFGAYLAISNVWPRGSHGNEAFSAMRRTGYKNFVRLHIGRDGALTLWAIGLDRVLQEKRWQFDAAGADEAPWLAPDGDPPVARLIDRVDIPAP